jgi:hypothetical protein
MATNESTATSACMNVQPQEEHLWLQKFVGEWTFEGEACIEPGQPPSKHLGKETVRPIGGLWIQGEGQGEMPGGGMATMLLTLGYDIQKKRFVGTWLGSMMAYLWIYDGELDSTRRILSLHADGPDMAQEGKMAKYKDVIEWKSDDHRILTSHMLGEDGKWQAFMTAHYRRKK